MIGVPSTPSPSSKPVGHPVVDGHWKTDLSQECSGGVPCPPQPIEELPTQEGWAKPYPERVAPSGKENQPPSVPSEGSKGPLPDLGLILMQAPGFFVGGH